MQTVIVTGSRDWPDSRGIWAALDRCREYGMTLLVHGDCRGADRQAAAWAAQKCFPVAAMPAPWDAVGNGAGPLRNTWMLDAFPNAIVLAFPLPGSRGTVDCIEKAKAHGMMVAVHGDGIYIGTVKQ